MKAMPRFHIYSEDSLVGWSELELGDPPMGVAFGKFIPAPAYAAIQSSIVDSDKKDKAVLLLSARLSDGTQLEAVGVCITDYSADLGPDGLEVSVLGITKPAYTRLFQDHIAAYELQFPLSG